MLQDVYAFGILMWEILSGYRPYEGFTDDEIIEMVKSHKRPSRSHIPADCSPQHLIKIMTSCWDSDPKQRPSFIDVLHHLDSDQNVIVNESELTDMNNDSQPLDDAEISRFAQEHSPTIMEIAALQELGLTAVELEHIRYDHRDAYNINMAIILKWRRRAPEEATRERLHSTIRRVSSRIQLQNIDNRGYCRIVHFAVLYSILAVFVLLGITIALLSRFVFKFKF